MAEGITLYGIKTCSTVRKAVKWLEEHDIGFRYHDLRKDGLAQAVLAEWCAASGWEKLLNRSSMTFRRLDEGEKQGLDAGRAERLMLEHPTLIRRPVLVMDDGQLVVGFKPELYEGIFSPVG